MTKVGIFVCGFIVFGAACLPAASTAPPVARTLQNVPAWFEPNQGLFSAKVKYLARGAGYALLLEESGTAALSLLDGSSPTGIRIALVGGNSKPAIEAVDRLAARSDYFLGNQPDKWQRGVPHFARVRYRNAYPGIDLVYYGAGRQQLEYDFVVSPGADPRNIRMRFEGLDSVRLDESGALVLRVGGHQVVQPKPLAYQERAGGRRVNVEGRYMLGRNGEVHFSLGKYDRKAPLVIDPILVYSGYFGGDLYDAPTGMAVDRDGNVWVTGNTLSTFELPEQNEPYKGAPIGKFDIFVAKLSVPTSGQPTLLYYTYLGGVDQDWGGQIALDGDGNVYLTGSTVSFDFPKTANAFSTELGGAQNVDDVYNLDAVVMKLNPAAAGADSLVFSSFLGGTGSEAPRALALGPDGTMLVAGYTSSLDMVLVNQTAALQPGNRGGWDAFLFKIDPNAAAGEALKFNTFFGGTATDVATGVAVDASGAVYLSGYTYSEDFPVFGDNIQNSLRGFSNLFVAKLDLNRTNLDIMVYSSYLGSTGVDIAQAMAIDSAGGLWLTGYTMSDDFPVTPNAFRPAFGGGASDVFLTRVDLSIPGTQAITYSTYFGGSGAEVAYGLAPIAPGKIALAGYTLSKDLPLASALPVNQTRSLMADAFVAILDSTQSGTAALPFSMYFGGASNDVAGQVVSAPSGSLYVTGYSGSQNLPTTDGSQKQSPPGSTSGFLLRVDPISGEQPQGVTVDSPRLLPSRNAVKPRLADGANVSRMVPVRRGLSLERSLFVRAGT